MKDNITVDCGKCGKGFQIDRDEYAAFGEQETAKHFSFTFAGNVAEAGFQIHIAPTMDMCPTCCYLVACVAVDLWHKQIPGSPQVEQAQPDPQMDDRMSHNLGYMAGTVRSLLLAQQQASMDRQTIVAKLIRAALVLVGILALATVIISLWH